MLHTHSSQVFFLQTYRSILLKRSITFSDWFKSTNLQYLASKSWKNCCLKLLYKLHSNRKWISLSTLFEEQSWHILRFSGVLGGWYLSVSILNLWLLDSKFCYCPAVLFVFNKVYIFWSAHIIIKSGIEIEFFVKSQPFDPF